jgi:hypothetical protein
MTLVQGTKEEVKAEAVPVPASTTTAPVKN